MFETLPPLLAVSLRFILAGGIMALVVPARGGSLRISRSSLGAALLIGCLLPGANAVLFFAERDVPTGLASLIIAAVPPWVVVLRLVGGQRLPPLSRVGVGVGFRRRRGAVAPVRRRDRRRRAALRLLVGDVGGRLVCRGVSRCRTIRSRRRRTKCSVESS